jgi:hypothetical protein
MKYLFEIDYLKLMTDFKTFEKRTEFFKKVTPFVTFLTQTKDCMIFGGFVRSYFDHTKITKDLDVCLPDNVEVKDIGNELIQEFNCTLIRENGVDLTDGHSKIDIPSTQRYSCPCNNSDRSWRNWFKGVHTDPADNTIEIDLVRLDYVSSHINESSDVNRLFLDKNGFRGPPGVKYALNPDARIKSIHDKKAKLDPAGSIKVFDKLRAENYSVDISDLIKPPTNKYY